MMIVEESMTNGALDSFLRVRRHTHSCFCPHDLDDLDELDDLDGQL